MQERRFNVRIAAILILALLVRLLGIAARPIWYDEAFSILFAEKGLSAMLYGTLAPTGTGSADIHPLGYYTLLWLWMKIFDESIIVVRILSIIAGMVVVYLVYPIALEITSDARTAELGMFIAALAPFQVHYAQEIRMYAVLALWLLLATYACFRGVRENHWKWWVLFSISAALAQYSHSLAAFYLIPLSILPLLQRNWRALRAVILAGVGALILYSPWLIQLPAQFTKVQNSYWVERPDISRLFTLLLVYITNTPLPAQFVSMLLAVTLLIVLIGAIQTVRNTRKAGGSPGDLLLYLCFAQPLILFLFSQWKPVYIERALLPSGAIFCIWLAWVVTKTNLSKIAQITFLGLLSIAFTAGIFQHISYQDFPYGPFKELDTSLQQRVMAGDVILHSNKLSMVPSILFAPLLSQSFIRDPEGSSTDTLAPATQEVLGIRAETDIQTATGSAGRVWYIIYERSILEYQAAGYSTHPDLEYLNSRFQLQTEEQWNGLRLFLYSKEP